MDKRIEPIESKPKPRMDVESGAGRAKWRTPYDRRKPLRLGEIVGWPELDAKAVSMEMGMTIRRLRWWLGEYGEGGRHKTPHKRGSCRTLRTMIEARKLASIMGIGMEELVERWMKVEELKKEKWDAKRD